MACNYLKARVSVPVMFKRIGPLTIQLRTNSIPKTTHPYPLTQLRSLHAPPCSLLASPPDERVRDHQRTNIEGSIHLLRGYVLCA